VMGTRSGDFDPAIIFYLAGKGHDLASISAMCNRQSGLLGLSGLSNDMRTLADLAARGNTSAQFAVDVFCYRVKKYIGAYTAVLDTVDALVFTGGIGENAVDVRTRICTGLTQIGIELDAKKNAAAAGVEALISADSSRIKVLVIPTDEEGAIASDTFKLATGRQNQ
jgi:acetate kinase